MGYSRKIPNLNDFRKAADRIKNIALRTPLIPLRWYKKNPNILLKAEILQPIGSYKIRGVYNWAARLEPEKRALGISTISSGNMAQAVAYVGNYFNIPARALIWDDAPKSKFNAVESYGAEVIPIKREESSNYTNNLPKDRSFLHGGEEYILLEGHGTIGLEIIEDAPKTDTIYVPVGAGFLCAGIALAAKALKPSVRVVGVNSENVPHYYESFKQGKPVSIERKPTLADGISSGVASKHMLRLLQDNIDKMMTISEEDIMNSIRLLATENKLVVEGAGAASLAAALNTKQEKRGNTVCILSGGSIDPNTLSKILKSS
jgi:threonine dehydratase